MFKQSLIAAAVLGAVSSPAFALGNAGFEFGTTSQWTRLNGEVATQINARRNPTIKIVDEADPSFTYEETVAPRDGAWLGVITMNKSFTSTPGVKQASATYRFTANQQPTTTTDVLAVRLFSADYIYPTFKDFVTVEYVLGGGVKFRDIIEDDGTFNSTPGSYSAPDTGWIDLAVPIGTKFINVKITNAYNRFANNVPTLLLDYYTYTGAAAPISTAGLVTAVPEPASLAMMFAGLVGVGAMARRRQGKRNAA